MPVINSGALKPQDESGPEYVTAPQALYEDFGGGHSKLRYKAGARVPVAEYERLHPTPAKKEPEVEDKKAPAPANKKPARRKESFWRSS